ncbi:hypothetical protein HOI83_00375 [Candidatus Uhrbacteria bacterium]|jgi:hypothetical protein|nr:hypothetical protein [Candidatus Uhrbacteria bacterium]
MTRTTKQKFFAGLSVLYIFAATPAFAQINATNTGLSASGGAAGFGTTPADLPVVIGQVIAALVGLLGILLAIYLIYGGVLWLTAAGDPDKVTKAKHIISNTVIGILIVLVSFAATTFIINTLGQASRGELIQADQAATADPS